MEKMYEVLRFVEHGADCRQSIDCLQGELLIYYLRDNTQMEKTLLFEWFRQIAGEVRKYQQSRHGQNYRCLTPYSIVVTEEGELFLLNPDAQENEFAMKKMQQKAVRRHFIRPSGQSGSRQNYPADLYGYGKILQFLLAYTEQIPELNKAEERRLERIIERCTEGGRRPYDKISQVIRDLPEERTEWNMEQKEKFRKMKLAVLLFTAGAVIAAAGIGLGRGKAAEQEEVTAQEEAKKEDVQIQEEATAEKESANREAVNTESVKIEVEKDILMMLVDVYEHEEQTEEAIQICNRLLKLEKDEEEIRKIEQKKVRLEQIPEN